MQTSNAAHTESFSVEGSIYKGWFIGRLRSSSLLQENWERSSWRVKSRANTAESVQLYSLRFSSRKMGKAVEQPCLPLGELDAGDFKVIHVISESDGL